MDAATQERVTKPKPAKKQRLIDPEKLARIRELEDAPTDIVETKVNSEDEDETNLSNEPTVEIWVKPRPSKREVLQPAKPQEEPEPESPEPLRLPELERENRPHVERFMLREWRRQVPPKSRAQLLPGKKFVLDPKGRIWAKQAWIRGYEELRWDGDYWFVWGDSVPDVLTLNGKTYRTEEYRIKWAKKACVRLIPI